MEFQDVVRRRRMVRKFTDEPVAEASLQRILRNALKGPSAGFSQGQGFLVLTGEELAKFWEFGASWAPESVTTAPVAIVPLSVKNAYLDRYAKPDKGFAEGDDSWWRVPYWDVDTGMAALLILQTAVDEGLGAVFFGLAPESVERLHGEFGVPEDHEPIGVVALGHGDEPGPSPGSSATTVARRDFSDVIRFGHW
ncbi:nitroreductase family protein [Amycolatopsis sp. BJA-103]|uniref:nitroreductase family protein n=1 Tax=Amycolatopsis sp. BJA-103 TaxID=1911175 RepID=UPI000C75A557|nr:nitroreductase family protein [Amycolatopsis sp. BJA-103]AUI62201.1 nitroreductase [Amycolatopsis sp. BJA-103]PNE20498.1 nitroreductase [Amycolatopsis sp. BJA-103]